MGQNPIFVASSSSLKVKKNDIEAFNNQDSQNLKEQFQLGIKYAEIQKGKKILQKTKERTGIPDAEPIL